MANLELHEASFSAVPIQEAGEGSPKGIWRIRLIEADVQGSSGYYPAETLRRDGPVVFPKGTHIFYNHPTRDERWERPERDVKDLAGEFVEAAHFEENGPDGSGLFANVQFFPDVHEWMWPRKNSVGMSIRASGMSADTEHGETIVALTEGLSVDIVTRAGAGGKVLQLMESGKNNAPQGGGATGADVTALSQKVDTLTEGQNKVLESVTSLVKALSESLPQKGEDEGLTAAQIVAKLDESDLPAPSRKRLAEAYKVGDDFDQMVKDEKALVAEILESAKPAEKPKVTRSSGDLTNGVLEESSTNTQDIDSSLNDLFKKIGLEG